jgi:hypothetical protein
MYKMAFSATVMPAFKTHPLSIFASLYRMSGFLSWLSICVKLVVLQLIIIILSSELKFTHFEVVFGEDKEPLVSEFEDKSTVEALAD